MDLILRNILRASALTTRLVSVVRGVNSPLVHIIEYPRSGGTWLSKMVAELLDLPFYERSKTPVISPAVIHGHWTYNHRYHRVIYVYRDGRDVVVSRFFHMRQACRMARDYRLIRYLSSLHPYFFGEDQVEDKDVLSLFINDWICRPVGVKESWPEHICQWIGHEDVCYVSYEQLLMDCSGSLSRIAKYLVEDAVEDGQVSDIVDKYSFKQQTQREPGVEQQDAFMRKGIAGDWKNYFTPRCAEVFNDYCGDELLKLGYTEDLFWPANVGKSS